MGKRHQLLFVSAALAALLSCSSGVPGTTACKDSSDCATDELCHPTAKFCVKGCSLSADCSDSAKTCAPLNGSGAFCQCTTDALCNTGNKTNQVCSTIHHLCLPKCARDSDCPNNGQCDTASGQCGADPQVACSQGTCIRGICNFSSGLCAPALTCDANAEQPDDCSYGQFCSAGTCAEVPPATCSNFTFTPTWGRGSTGPIIWSLMKFDITHNDSFCPPLGSLNTRYKVRVEAYDVAGSFPTSDLSQHGADELAIESVLRLVDPNGTTISSNNTVQSLTTSADHRNATFYVNFCRSGTTTSFSAGLQFVGGNEVCLLVQ